MPAIKTVAVVDDDDDAAMTMMHTLEDADFQPFRQKAEKDLDTLVSAILKSSDAAVCDNRLRYGAFADIAGAELAAKLVRSKHPTILVTQYLDQDADIAIRSFRHDLPVVLRREEADEPEELRSAFAKCILEIERGKTEGRKPQRTLLRVMEVMKVNDDHVVDAVVHGWNAKDTVRFPLSLVDPKDRDKVKRSVTLSAEANVRADLKVELYFRDVRLADDVDPDDGLQ